MTHGVSGAVEQEGRLDKLPRSTPTLIHVGGALIIFYCILCWGSLLWL